MVCRRCRSPACTGSRCAGRARASSGRRTRRIWRRTSTDRREAGEGPLTNMASQSLPESQNIISESDFTAIDVGGRHLDAGVAVQVPLHVAVHEEALAAHVARVPHVSCRCKCEQTIVLFIKAHRCVFGNVPLDVASCRTRVRIPGSHTCI